MKIEVRRSSIHGRGVFATRAIRKDERIGRFLARRTNRDGRYVLWLEDENGAIGYNGYGRLRYLNHDHQPNAGFFGLDLYALRAIRPGEEITIDYGEDSAAVA